MNKSDKNIKVAKQRRQWMNGRDEWITREENFRQQFEKPAEIEENMLKYFWAF